MKMKSARRSTSTSTRTRRENNKMKGSLARHLQVQNQHQQQKLGQLSFKPPKQKPSSSFSFPNPSSRLSFESDAQLAESLIPSSAPFTADTESNPDGKDYILSQDFFCTPDYITPDCQYMSNAFDCNKDNIPCPKSPEKIKTVKRKRQKLDGVFADNVDTNFSCHDQVEDHSQDFDRTGEIKPEQVIGAEPPKEKNYVSESAILLRSRVMPPPCIRNPYLQDGTVTDIDPFDSQRSKCSGFFPSNAGGDGLSRYRTDFHEIEQIGIGNFSRVFKVLKRIDGCFYAVKQSTRLLHQDTERRKALMEVQALAALGSHENVVGYYSSWFENEQFFIQMELCDRSLSVSKSPKLTVCGVLEVMHQVAKALQFIHERGVAHLDVKPENIYVKNGVYKLGDFGCATLIDKSLPIEEGDARYMPQEILNDKYDHLDKVDIFSLGVTIFELITGSPLPESGPLSCKLKQGKLPLIINLPTKIQNLLTAMINPDPTLRPSAKDLVEHAILLRARELEKASKLRAV